MKDDMTAVKDDATVITATKEASTKKAVVDKIEDTSKKNDEVGDNQKGDNTLSVTLG